VKNLHRTIILLVILGFLPFVTNGQHDDLLEGKTWKSQGLNTIIPAWTEHGIDSTDGQFYAYMDREWNPYNDNLKYPGMLSRHLFSLSTAYMLSGDQKYLDNADQLFDYLIEYGWDHQHGGWYYAIYTSGKAVDTEKDLFMNIYAITGLTLYYMITHDRQAMNYIRKTRDLLNEHAWDDQNGGYYRKLNRQWEVTNNAKVFTPQVAPVSGYLLYLYAATRNQDYLDKSERLMGLVSNHMQDSETGWIREQFDRDWAPTSKNRDEEQIDIGHNVEVAWMWLRLYGITGDSNYKQKAVALYNKLHQHAFQSNGAWLHKMGLTNPKDYPKTTNWWIQAYGNMLELPMYHYKNNTESLEYFKKGSSFWNNVFVDQQFGGTVLSATLDGTVDRGDKAVRTKTSYHAMELALLNYLYLNLWVAEKPVTLYFNFDSGSDSKPLCPLPITDSEATITEATVNGNSLDISDHNRRCISISGEAQKTIKIRME